MCYFSTVRTENSLRNVFESISSVMREKYGKREDTRICDLKDAARILFRFAKNYERRTDGMSPLRRRRDAFRMRFERKRIPPHHVHPSAPRFGLDMRHV